MKPKTKPKPASPIPIDAKMLSLGFMPEHWKRVFHWQIPLLAKRIAERQLIDLTPIQRKGAYRVCAFCGVEEADNTFACQCIAHVCGNQASSRTKLSAALGKCGDQAHCISCCSCLKCSKCQHLYKRQKRQIQLGRPKQLVCSICNCCTDSCCQCTKCTTCNILIGKDRCACSIQSSHHAKCCSSTERIRQHGERVLFIDRYPRFAVGTNFQHVRTRRLMSVETEILAVDKPESFPSFNLTMRDLHCGVVHEGTVPNGFEINSNPASGDLFQQEILGITNSLNDLKGLTNIRCGTHVHVDARDFYYVDLVNLIYLYHKIEPALFAMLPPWRRISRFAVPCREQLMKIANNGQKIVQTLRDPDLANYYPSTIGLQYKRKSSIAVRIAENLYQSRSLCAQKFIHKNSTNQRLRYMALNLHSWVYRRTLEFRHWAGSTNKHELLCWAQICAAILDAAKRLPIDQSLNGTPTIAKLSKHPIEALLDILRPSSRVSSALRPFVESKLRQWSPDFDVWWPIAQIGGRDSILPFKDISHDELCLSFDLKNQAFTYINPRHHAIWDIEWLSPKEHGGRYAKLTDLHAIPDKGTLLWMAPEAIVQPPTPKIKLNPEEMVTTAAQTWATRRMTMPMTATVLVPAPILDAYHPDEEETYTWHEPNF